MLRWQRRGVSRIGYRPARDFRNRSDGCGGTITSRSSIRSAFAGEDAIVVGRGGDGRLGGGPKRRGSSLSIRCCCDRRYGIRWIGVRVPSGAPEPPEPPYPSFRGLREKHPGSPAWQLRNRKGAPIAWNPTGWRAITILEAVQLGELTDEAGHPSQGANYFHCNLKWARLLVASLPARIRLWDFSSPVATCAMRPTIWPGRSVRRPTTLFQPDSTRRPVHAESASKIPSFGPNGAATHHFAADLPECCLKTERTCRR